MKIILSHQVFKISGKENEKEIQQLKSVSKIHIREFVKVYGPNALEVSNLKKEFHFSVKFWRVILAVVLNKCFSH